MDNKRVDAVRAFLDKNPELKEMASDRKALEDYLSKNPESVMELANKLVWELNPPHAKLYDHINELPSSEHDNKIKLCLSAITSYPEYAYKFADMLSDIYEEQRNFEKAAIYLDLVIQCYPENAKDYHEILALKFIRKSQYFEQLKLYEEALESIEQAIRPGSDWGRAFLFKGELLFRLKRFSESYVATDMGIRQAMKKQPPNNRQLYDLYNLRSKINEATNNQEEANSDHDIAVDYHWKWVRS